MNAPHPHAELISQWARDPSQQIEGALNAHSRFVARTIKDVINHPGYSYRIAGVLPLVNGETIRCTCGCLVFNKREKPPQGELECRSCGNTYDAI